MIRIALDVMGGDAAPATPLEGARAALEAWPDDIALVLVGPEDAVAPQLPDFPADRVSWPMGTCSRVDMTQYQYVNISRVVLASCFG